MSYGIHGKQSLEGDSNCQDSSQQPIKRDWAPARLINKSNNNNQQQNSQQQHQNFNNPFTSHQQQTPFPPDPFNNYQDAPPMASMEPPKLKDIWFARDLATLLSFLRIICDFLRQNQVFQLDSRKVVWISKHFGYPPLEHRRVPSPVENWYNSLVIDNTR
ncbi:hypothetical protein PCANC_04476 [Puccinia coronata f. sp. avenae]|uniref:Uncharacterized protein n=1 Tax=Puccinia coronata f. sp. avenae TaxID=200324 RepID=A0A2N5VUQ6_9BASI|nr:hypothetical protein PCANC_08756 [Puccinia coronata f. sp. avenae]PLW39544.1 hypothetical protein PCASD_07674 [Puccinia coronata f. sp. avenae]PLW53719.1 hypothetical protein PCANC_04476 [Puccinia coronata f. sp. avenae]